MADIASIGGSIMGVSVVSVISIAGHRAIAGKYGDVVAIEPDLTYAQADLCPI